MTIQGFKRQFGPVFGQQMKLTGFSGAGSRYTMNTKAFLFIIEVLANEANHVNLTIGIHPETIRFRRNKLNARDCELYKLLMPSIRKMHWDVGVNKKLNEKLANKMFTFVQTNILPIITRYKTEPNPLDDVLPSDIVSVPTMFKKLYGMYLEGVPNNAHQAAWTLSSYYYHKCDWNMQKLFFVRALTALIGQE